MLEIKLFFLFAEVFECIVVLDKLKLLIDYFDYSGVILFISF